MIYWGVSRLLNGLNFFNMTLNINDLWITSERIHISKAESHPVCLPKGGLLYEQEKKVPTYP